MFYHAFFLPYRFRYNISLPTPKPGTKKLYFGLLQQILLIRRQAALKSDVKRRKWNKNMVVCAEV